MPMDTEGVVTRELIEPNCGSEFPRARHLTQKELIISGRKFPQEGDRCSGIPVYFFRLYTPLLRAAWLP